MTGKWLVNGREKTKDSEIRQNWRMEREKGERREARGEKREGKAKMKGEKKDERENETDHKTAVQPHPAGSCTVVRKDASHAYLHRTRRTIRPIGRMDPQNPCKKAKKCTSIATIGGNHQQKGRKTTYICRKF